MAGGIDWFRWHHGSVTDPKFQLVARKAKQSLPIVIAVWAFVLEQASAAVDRGTYKGIDCEAIDCLFDLDEGATASILAEMQSRHLIDGERVCAWDKRQPKRERDDASAADRKRRQRQNDAETNGRDTLNEANDNHVTPCHAMSRQDTPREEESREEDIHGAIAPLSETAVSAAVPNCPHDRLLDLFAEKLPELPQPRRSLWGNSAGAESMRARWRWVMTASETKHGQKRRIAETVEQGLDWFARFFGYVASCPHLMGDNARGWTADLAWLMKSGNFTKVVQGNYQAREGVAA